MADREKDSVLAQRGFQAAAAVVGVIVICGLVVLLTGGDDPSPPTSGQAPAAKRKPAKAQAQGCNLSAGPQKALTSAPPNTKWELLGRIAVPTAPATYGPGRENSGVRSCYAHSATGALYAAVNIIAATADGPTRHAATKYLTADGVGRDRALADRDRSTSSGATLQIAGFRFTSYSRSVAVIDIASKASLEAESFDTHVSLAMRWEGNDWKLSIPDTGDPFAGTQRLPDRSGYVQWAGA